MDKIPERVVSLHLDFYGCTKGRLPERPTRGEELSWAINVTRWFCGRLTFSRRLK